jgi:hypothetical protein
MNKKRPYGIGEGGRRAIYFGVPMVLMAVCMCTGEFIAHLVGEKAWPYIIYGLELVIIVAGMLLYNCLPKRSVIPLGIAGWVISFLLIYWFVLFGPGALKMGPH